MGNYYLLSCKHTVGLASAFAECENMLDAELIKKMEGINILPFDFELKRVKETTQSIIIDANLSELNTVWLDYQPCNLGCPLMSESLKSTVERQLTGNEGIDWIECKVKWAEEMKIYYILRFNKLPDVLDMERTTFVKGTSQIIKPVFSAEKIKKYSVFSKPALYNLWKITPGMYVNDDLKKAITKCKFTGLSFEKVAVK